MSKPQETIDREWRAEDDARTLANAQEIKADKRRLSAAVRKARELANKASKEANRLSIISKTKSVVRPKSNIRKTRKAG